MFSHSAGTRNSPLFLGYRVKTRKFQGQAEVSQMMTHGPLSQAMEALCRKPRSSGVSLTGPVPLLPPLPPPLLLSPSSLFQPLSLAQFPGVVAVVLSLLGTRALSIKCPAWKFHSNDSWGLAGQDPFPPGPGPKPGWGEKLLESHTDL